MHFSAYIDKRLFYEARNRKTSYYICSFFFIENCIKHLESTRKKYIGFLNEIRIRLCLESFANSKASVTDLVL